MTQQLSGNKADTTYETPGIPSWINGLAGGSYTLPVASASVLGGVKAGTGITIAGDGTASATGTAGVGTFNTRSGTVVLLTADVTGVLGSGLPVANGGTGATTTTAALTALGAAPIASPTFTGTVTGTFSGNLTGNASGTAANVTGLVAVANGGTGTATPGIVAGTNVTVSGTWPNQTVNSSGGGSSRSIAVALTAAGTTQGTATALTTDDSVVTTVAAGTGVKLAAANGQVILNRGVNTLSVYPPTGGTIESGATNAAVTIPAGSSAVFHTSNGTAFYAR